MSNVFKQLQVEIARGELADEPCEAVDGPMNCQTCNETVKEGLLYPNKKLVTWVCSKQHLSKLTNYE